MSDPRELYQAVIVAHDRAPQHLGPLPGATHEATIDNPMCGDVVTLRLILDGDTIRDARFEGHGCALSRAAASILTSRLIGLDRTAAHALASRFTTFVRESPDAPVPADLGDLAAFAGVRRARARQGCATLPFRALATALR